jgi:hypothetical protein
MKPYCEIVSQYLLPTMRALVAKALMEKHGMTQQDAASKIGLTQSAVSQYMRQLRGKSKLIENDKEIMKEIESVAARIASGELSKLGTIDSFCDMCRLARKKKALCELHAKTFSELKDCTKCQK